MVACSDGDGIDRPPCSRTAHEALDRRYLRRRVEPIRHGGDSASSLVLSC